MGAPVSRSSAAQIYTRDMSLYAYSAFATGEWADAIVIRAFGAVWILGMIGNAFSTLTTRMYAVTWNVLYTTSNAAVVEGMILNTRTSLTTSICTGVACIRTCCAVRILGMIGNAFSTLTTWMYAVIRIICYTASNAAVVEGMILITNTASLTTCICTGVAGI
jgi:hypothetical protein